MKILWQMLFPTRCPVCDSIVKPFGEKICLECLPKLRVVTPPWCMKCGKKIRDDGEFCSDCRQKQHMFDRSRTLYEYAAAAPSIYRFKYKGRQEYAEFFGEEMGKYLGDFIRSVSPDVLVPVPLHKKKLSKRGYNQAACLARALGKTCSCR